MCVDNLRQLEASVRLLLEVREYSVIKLDWCTLLKQNLSPYSDGFAGSMMTASLVLSSETK